MIKRTIKIAAPLLPLLALALYVGVSGDFPLDDDWAYVVASDAHNLGARPPRLSAARQAVADRLGEDVAQLMFHTRPARILGVPLNA